MGRAFWTLALAQGLFILNNVVLLAINALVGLKLAPMAGLSTLPMALSVVGAAVSTAPVARLQRQWGRRKAFQAGMVAAVLAYALCAVAVLRGDFWLLCLGSALAGFYAANASLYRFASTELVPEALRERALSLVLVGGLVGALFGPNLARYSRDFFELPYVGAYAALSVLAGLAWVLMARIEFPAMPPLDLSRAGRHVRELARQPAFVVAILAAAVGFGVMSLLMNATPIAMHQHDHSFEHSAWVLEWHVIAMFAPSLFSGRLIKRFGHLRILAAGLALMFACTGLAIAGVDLMHFYAALIALGLGWNFLYTGASALLLETYLPEEKTTAQAAMDFWVFVFMALASLGSGYLVTGRGWTALNEVAILPLVLLAGALLHLARQEGPKAAA